LPVKLLNKFSGVQQGNARLLHKDRRPLQALQPTVGLYLRGLQVALQRYRNLYPLPASTIGSQPIFLRERLLLLPIGSIRIARKG
jgi:hypothetical protein